MSKWQAFNFIHSLDGIPKEHRSPSFHPHSLLIPITPKAITRSKCSPLSLSPPCSPQLSLSPSLSLSAVRLPIGLLTTSRRTARVSGSSSISDVLTLEQTTPDTSPSAALRTTTPTFSTSVVTPSCVASRSLTDRRIAHPTSPSPPPRLSTQPLRLPLLPPTSTPRPNTATLPLMSRASLSLFQPPPTSWTTSTTTTSSTPASSPSSGSSGGSVQTGGVATYFTQNGVAGACGIVHPDSALIVAIDKGYWPGYESGDASPLCGRSLTITNTDNGNTVTATVQDVCPTCDNLNSLDLSSGAFLTIAGALAVGEVPITWVWD